MIPLAFLLLRRPSVEEDGNTAQSTQDRHGADGQWPVSFLVNSARQTGPDGRCQSQTSVEDGIRCNENAHFVESIWVVGSQNVNFMEDIGG